MSKKRIHVVPHRDGGWATRTEGATRVGGRFPTQGAAFEQGRSQARRERAELVIHRPNGQIRDSNSYGPDPFPPKG